MSTTSAMSASPPEIVARPLSYVSLLTERGLDQVRLLVIHCTELPDLAMARDYGERELYASGTGNSGHFYIDRDGRTECWVPIERIAHHVRNGNANSIGIELVNAGRWPDWYDSRRQEPEQTYPDVQIQALIDLILGLRAQLPWIEGVAGHEDLDTSVVAASDDPDLQVRRKIDPGVQFPWLRLLHGVALPRVHG